MKSTEILKQITQLCSDHENELLVLKEGYDKEKKIINNEIARINSDKINDQLTVSYLEMANVLSKIMSDLTKVQKSFTLDGFSTDAEKEIKAVKPRKKLNLNKTTEDWAAKVQEEAVDIIKKISKCESYDEMLPLLKAFYQTYADAMYIKDNIVALLKESGVYVREVTKLTDEQNAKMALLSDEYKENKKTENLKVYPKLVELKEELKNIRATEKDYRLTNGDIEFGNGYSDSFLMGIHQRTPIKPEIISYAKKYLADDLHGFNEEKMEWDLNSKNNALIIDLPAKIMAERSASRFFDYIEQLLFTLFSSLPVRKLQLAGIDCPAPNNQSISSPFVPIIQRAEKYLGGNIMYAPIVRDKNKLGDLIDSLFMEGQRRSDTYFSEGYENIYNYNQATIDNQHDFKFLLINNYPYGFDEPDIVAKLVSLIKNGDTGIIPIIFQASEKAVYQQKTNNYSDEFTYTYLDYKELGASYLTNFDFTKKTFTYNGVSGSFDLEAPNFNNLKYWDDINHGYQNANILYIDTLLSQSEKASIKSGKKYSSYDHKLRIPIGKANGDIYDFTINVKDDSSAIILGTTGSGKSSLLHSLVLSAAYTYSPKELQICLVDFKGADASTEFSLYKKGKELYLPHINYLSLKSTTENALDMLDMLETIQNERMKLIAKNNVANVVEYNNLPNVKNNPNKIMPRMLFIIDEFNTMLAGGAAKAGDSSIDDVIETRIFSLLTRVRSSGITIIFSGHTTAGLNDRHMSQIKIRVGLNGFVGRLFEIKYTEADLDVSNVLNEKGKSVISTDLGKNKTVVSLAYSGEMGSKRQLALADKIRSKYASLGNDFAQVVAGSTDLVRISEMKTLDETIKAEEKMDKDSYPAYMGVTSTSSMPVSIRFSSEQSAMNYLMTGESSRLAIYERNLVLGFAYMLKVRQIASKKPNISYIRISRGIKDNQNALAAYSDYKLIKNQVVMVENEMDACNEILKVFDLYQSRLKKANKDTTPYLLVVHNVSWLKETVWLDNSSEVDDYVEEEVEYSTDIASMDVNSLIASLNVDSMVENKPEPVVTTKDEKTEINPKKVAEALSTLYAKGYMQNIFVVLASPITADLNTYIEETGRGNIAYNYAISDSFKFNSTTNKYPSSCCHINSTKIELDENAGVVNTKFVSSKTRLFDYSIQNESAFLKKFNEVK